MSFLSKISERYQTALAASKTNIFFGSNYKAYKARTDYSTYGISGCFFGHGLYVSTSKTDAKSYGKYIRTLTLPNAKFFNVSSIRDYELLYKYLDQDFTKAKNIFSNIKKTGSRADEMKFFEMLSSLLKTDEVGSVAVTRKIEQMGYDGLYIPKRISGSKGDWYTFFKPQKYFSNEELNISPKSEAKRKPKRSQDA